MKKIAVWIVFFFVLSMSGVASANHMEGRSAGGHGKSLEGAAYMELALLIKYSRALKLTDEQLQTLKDKKYEIRRQDIQLDSQLALVSLDIKKQLASDAPNPTQLEALIDNKTELNKTLDKAFAKTIVDAQSLLTPEQRAKFKELVWQGCFGSCPFHRAGKHHHKGK